MPPHNEYFWAAIVLVAVLAVFALLRLLPKRTNLSAAECARRDKGGAPPDELDQAPPKPPPDEAA
ncbi:MAG: hypothetical protein JWR47_3419 [Phenylobacterium sp.]|uniref:hypothetical protein n=1 Tax=Phenylobacterium sp. TaxID=1871053 RepID=UPI00260A234B|nr:hypothetical protein [Phenylobacterium sp.]MDB5427555.1 hypothetical protein [Phenylobacterium sp.]MDB5437162.1 hypothetical protein [Phenylobacterium sp.]MDB5464960.1 hypothetical protein [Phenylobacterium sp.]MDB5498125.1 hypothetical protein [Phenylobacterium sp.]